MANQMGDAGLEQDLTRLGVVREVVETWNPYGWLPLCDWSCWLNEPCWQVVRETDKIVSAQDAIAILFAVFFSALDSDDFPEENFDVQSCVIAGRQLFDVLQKRDLLCDSGLKRNDRI